MNTRRPLILAGFLFCTLATAEPERFYDEQYREIGAGFLNLSHAGPSQTSRILEIIHDEEFVHNERLFLALQRMAALQGYDDDLKTAVRINLSKYIYGFLAEPTTSAAQQLAIKREIMWWSAFDQNWIERALLHASTLPEIKESLDDIVGLVVAPREKLEAFPKDTPTRLCVNARLDGIKVRLQQDDQSADLLYKEVDKAKDLRPGKGVN